MMENNTNRSTDRCPNCDSYIESDYCYSCGYTTKEYNYLANSAYNNKVYKESESLAKSRNMIKSIYKNAKVIGSNIYLPFKIYSDINRTKLRSTIKSIHKKYNVKYDYHFYNEQK